MIPKVIHYCWFGGKPLPNTVKKLITNWKEVCPEYKVIQWDESNFDVMQNDFIAEAYKNKSWAFVSDYARLKILYDNGGIYLDTDVELLKDFDFLLDSNFFACISQKEHLCNTGLGFGAEKGCQVLRRMLNVYDNLKFDPKNKDRIACPIVQDPIIREFGYENTDNVVSINGLTILPPRYMDPLSPGMSTNLLCEDTISIHHYSATWTSGKNRVKRKLFNFIGQDRINSLKKLLGR